MKMIARVCRTIEASCQFRMAKIRTLRYQRNLFLTSSLAVAPPMCLPSKLIGYRGIRIQYYSSSSRFTSLLDDDEGDRKGRNRMFENENDDEEDEEEVDDDDYDEDDDDDSNDDYEDEDSVEWAEVFREQLGDPTIDEDIEDEVIRLFLEDPMKWTSLNLARAFNIPKAQIEAIIYFKGTEELGMDLPELKQRVRDAREKAAKLTKSEGQSQVDAKSSNEREALEDEDDMKVLLGVEQEEAFRNPDFFFLNDEFEGYPPLTRRLGKNTQSDQMYPKEATAMQNYATKRKFAFQKSFQKSFETPPTWKIAVKDISKPKNPTYIREGDGSFRLATDTEVMTRSWVRRPAFFQGLDD